MKVDGIPVNLRNLLDGTVVTLTEELPTVSGLVFADLVFSGDSVNDGGANSPGNIVTTRGTERIELTLTNTVRSLVKTTPVSPHIEPGVCAAGSTTPTDPTITLVPVDDITYSDPVLTTAADQATITLRATPKPGFQIAA